MISFWSDQRSIIVRVLTVWLLLMTIGRGALLARAWPMDSQVSDIKILRVAFHVFDDDQGTGNFIPDDTSHLEFLSEVVGWVNYRLGHLDTLRPAVPSPYVGDAKVRIRLDTLFFHHDTYAWDCSEEIHADYMRSRYIDRDSTLTYRQKYQTLPVLIGANYPIVGGFNSTLGDKTYIAVRGYFYSFEHTDRTKAVEECGKNLIHELGHSMGLSHNFRGGPHGDQCDRCDDNGCPIEGTSNNIMDYWPSYGSALSACQFKIIHEYLSGMCGNIAEVLVNDSCYRIPGSIQIVPQNTHWQITDTVYLHGDMVIRRGGHVTVTGYLSLPDHASVTVEPGGRLDLYDGVIGNLCGDLWSGIRIAEGGSIFLKNGTIENARKALELNRPAMDSLSGIEFINNVTGLEISRPLADSLVIHHCLFMTTRRLNHYEVGEIPVTMCLIDRPKQLLIDSCLFENRAGTFTFDPLYLGVGALIWGGQVTVTHNRFENLTRGIIQISHQPDERLILRQNLWVNNLIGVQAEGCALLYLQNNHFNLQRYDRQVTVGLMTYRKGRLVVLDNRFISTYGAGAQVAVWINDPGNTTSLIASNYLSKIPLGFYVSHPPDMDSLLISGLQFRLQGIDPGLGPQFRDNKFDYPEILLAVEDQSGFGIAFGHITHAPMESRTPDTWPVGGMLWYDAGQTPYAFLGATTGRPKASHGVYPIENLLGISCALPSKEDLITRLDPITGHKVYRELQNNLTPLTDSLLSDPFDWLGYLNIHPEITRSSKENKLWELLHIDQQAWLQEALARLSNQYLREDTLVTDWGTWWGMMNRDRWMASVQTMVYNPVSPPVGIFDSIARHISLLTYPDWFTLTVPVQEMTDFPAFILYPNPAGSSIKIKPVEGYRLGDEGWYFRMTQSDGRTVQSGWIRNSGALIRPVDHLPEGIYYLFLWQGQKFLGARSFFKYD